MRFSRTILASILLLGALMAMLVPVSSASTGPSRNPVSEVKELAPVASEPVRVAPAKKARVAHKSVRVTSDRLGCM